METKTKTKSKTTKAKVTANDEVARKTRNFVKNVRRDVVKLQGVQSDPNSSKYEVRIALGEKVATQSAVTALETLLANSTTNTEVANGVTKLVDELNTKVATLSATRKDPNASKYAKRRARAEETATTNVVTRLVKLQG